MERRSWDDDDDDDEKINMQAMMINEPLLNSPSSKGGIRTLPFIIANGAIQRMAVMGLTANMIIYLTQEYGMAAADAANVVFILVAATNFTPIVGAFLADSYLGRFPIIAIGSVVTSLGMSLVWLTSTFPSGCTQVSGENCQKSASTLQLLLLYISFALIALGCGGVGSSSLAFGADQIGNIIPDDPNPNLRTAAILQSFFNWYYAANTLAAMFAVTVVVYVQDSMGWKVGFALPTLLMVLSTLFFLLATPWYARLEPTSSSFTGLVQVIVVSWKRRHILLSSQANHTLVYCHGNHQSTTLLMPSDKFRFFNNACATRNPQQEVTPEGSVVDPWNLCTVDQVEELKLLIKLIPIWCNGIILALTLDQATFSTLLAKSMDRHITSNFELSPASFSTFLMLGLITWIVIYDCAIIPLASKIRGKPVRLTLYQRMGSGILCSFASMLSIALVESIRRKLAPQETLSAMWLVPYEVLLGVAEAFTGIAQIEFFYSEMPKTMSSISSNLFTLGMSVASLMASVVSTTVDEATKRGGESWVSSSVNKGHYDYYFFLLAGMCFVNFLGFLGCSKAYGPCKGDGAKVGSSKDDQIR